MAAVLTGAAEARRTEVVSLAKRHLQPVGNSIFLELYAVAEAQLYARSALPPSVWFTAGTLRPWGIRFERDNGFWYCGLVETHPLQPVSLIAGTTEGFWDLWIEGDDFCVNLEGEEFEPPEVLAHLPPGGYMRELVQRLMTAVANGDEVDLVTPPRP